MTKNLRNQGNAKNVGKRVVQICFLYVIALMTAVACGQGFKPRNLDELKGVISFNNPGNPGSFVPQLKDMTLLDQGGVLTLNVSMVDGTRSVYGLFGLGTTSFVGEEYVEGFNYRMDAMCTMMDCSSVVMLLTRANSTTKETVQNTYVLSNRSNRVTVVNQFQGTQYTSLDTAMADLGY